MKHPRLMQLAACALLGAASLACADITVGIDLSSTGPAAAIGIVNTGLHDHVGLDQRASVMGTIKNGKFIYRSN